jgi:hypothetical protein
MKEAWVIKLNCETEPLDDECATPGDKPFSIGQLYNSKGEKVNAPTCESCGQEKTVVIGMHASSWICLTCPMKYIGDE